MLGMRRKEVESEYGKEKVPGGGRESVVLQAEIEMNGGIMKAVRSTKHLSCSFSEQSPQVLVKIGVVTD